MLTSSDVIAMVPVSDLSAAETFYTSVLGLTPVSRTSSDALLDGNGTLVRLTKVPAVPRTSYAVLGWRVDDIDELVAALGQRGVTFAHYRGIHQDRAGVWTAPTGDRLAWFSDPDGNRLSLAQLATAHSD